jgi:hypothetical protein
MSTLNHSISLHLDGSQTTLTLSIRSSSSSYGQSVQGFVLDFSSLLIIVLLLLTTAQKARRTIFIFNFLSLLFLCIQSIFNLCFICLQSFYGIGGNFLGAVAQYPISALSIVSAFRSLFLNMIVTSLVLQVRVVFVAEPRKQKIITAFLSLSGLWVVGGYICSLRCRLYQAGN